MEDAPIILYVVIVGKKRSLRDAETILTKKIIYHLLRGGSHGMGFVKVVSHFLCPQYSKTHICRSFV